MQVSTSPSVELRARPRRLSLRASGALLTCCTWCVPHASEIPCRVAEPERCCLFPRDRLAFPVIEGMGEIQMSAAGELLVPEVIPARPQPNLALHELTPLTRVRWGEEVLLCRLDTGAGTTQLYEPFYRRFRERIDAAAEATTRPWGGAGGVRELPVRILSDVELALGDTAVALDSVAVLTQSIVRSEAENYLDCNIGRDILGSLSRYILNFRDMAFLLR